MATLAAALIWLRAALGKFWNPDNAHGYQCKDLVDAYVMAIFPGKHWSETVRPGNGKDVYANANPAYFTKVPNNPHDPAQLPPPGSILSFAGSAAVPEGHTAITEKADAAGVDVFQMDGYRQTAAHRARLPYDGLIGWLVPNLDGTGSATRLVTNEVAYVRTGPGTGYPMAPGYPDGIAQGATLAVVGYVAGEDPYNSGDDAWYKTKSGYFVWANAAGNDLSGLASL